MRILRFMLAPLLVWPPAPRCSAPRSPSVPPADQDALFHSPDPKLDANKQVAHAHRARTCCSASHWELGDKYLTKRYIQHNPNAKSGLAGVLVVFQRPDQVRENEGQAAGGAPVDDNVVSVVAEGDLVTVACARRVTRGSRGPEVTHLHHYLVRSVAHRRTARPMSIGIRRPRQRPRANKAAPWADSTRSGRS